MQWFRHDTNALRNRKLRKAIRSHGATAYAVYFALLEYIYTEEGEFSVLADELWLENLADDLRITDYRVLVRVLDTFAEVGLIDRQLWEGDHAIFIQSVVERGDAYLVKRAKEAEKKRVQRARKAELSPGDSKGTGGQTPQMSPSDPDPYSDPNSKAYSHPDPKHPELSVRKTPGQLDSVQDQSRPELKKTTAQPSVMNRPMSAHVNLHDPLAAMFARHPWRGSDGKVLPEYLEHVASQMKKDGNMHPKVMASRHIDKLEKAQDYDTLGLYLEQCQSQPTTTPAQSAADISRLAKQAIAQERTS